MKRVAVIGAGAAGLAALRRLAEHPDEFLPTAFEQSQQIGGVWYYTDMVGNDEEGYPIHTSMFKNLRTNLPKEIMAYPGYPFPASLPSHMKHQDVYQYLKDMADLYDLSKFIKLRTSVVKVNPLTTESETQWEVTTRQRGQKEDKIQLFDAVMVCNGHYSEPSMPEIPGMDHFTGDILHSHSYRSPEPFANKSVLVFGLGQSGREICFDVATLAKEVYISGRGRTMEFHTKPINLHENMQIKLIKANSVVLENGEEIGIDSLIFCTGYQYSFPFLTPECRITVDDGRVHPVYKHIIHPGHPSLSFIGLCQVVCNPLPKFDIQVQFVLAALTGRLRLPSESEMLIDIEKDYQDVLSRGMPHRHAHNLGYRMQEYLAMLADMAGVERIPPVTLKLFKHVVRVIMGGKMDYKDINYKIEDSENFSKI